MLAYAANRPVAGKRPSSPSAMLLIVSVHVALLALAMSAKMEFDRKPHPSPPLINVPIDRPPPPIGTATKKSATPTDDAQPTRARTDADLPPLGGDTVDGGQATGGGAAAGGGETSFPPPLPVPVRHDARLLTSPNDLKPPYPELKILSGEEATLHLRLVISESGRVTAVDPVGPADRVFLDAARRYLMAHWRYAPATEDGRAIASSVVISLRFQLDG